MPPWLQGVWTSTPAPHPGVLAARLALACVLGLFIAWISQVHRRNEPIDEGAGSFRVTLVLLAILICAVTQVIGDNVARAFSLVGALSIVRFRTVVQDTRDTAFVIFAVAVGMAVGAGDLWVAAITPVVVGLAALLLSAGKRSGAAAGQEYLLTLSLGLAQSSDNVVDPVLRLHTLAFRPVGAQTASRGAAIETRYEVRLPDGTDPSILIRALNDLEGVVSAELRRV